MTTTDIFIKTYYKDYAWLEWCLKSIAKFTSGYRNIVIVSDTGPRIPENFISIVPFNIHYVDLPKKSPTFVEHGVGYLWQQYIKLTWYEYTDADEVFIIDSDEMFTCSTNIQDFRISGKFPWYYRDWSRAGTGRCWKPSTDFMLKHDTPFDAMSVSGFVFQKKTSIALKNHICYIHDVGDIWDIVLKYDMPTFSEFNIYGNFVYLYDRDEYVWVINADISQIINTTIKKDWSWGGLTRKNMRERQEILNRV
jgi:hypothetical protein